MKKPLLFILSLISVGAVFGQSQILNSFKLNTTNTQASYDYYPSMPPTTGNTVLSEYGDVTALYYDNDYVYVVAEGLPTSAMGPWLAEDLPTAQGYVIQIPINPVENTSGTLDEVLAKGLAGFATDGVAFFGNASAESYSSSSSSMSQPGDGVWNEDAYVGESQTFDALMGHPQGAGVYHYHVTPIDLYDDTDASNHSPIIGWAADGFPVYGPYAYSDPLDNTSGIRRMETGYVQRAISVRTTLADGSTASSAGPAVDATYPIGTFLEDNEYDDLLGSDLDEHNGRFC